MLLFTTNIYEVDDAYDRSKGLPVPAPDGSTCIGGIDLIVENSELKKEPDALRLIFFDKMVEHLIGKAKANHARFLAGEYSGNR